MSTISHSRGTQASPSRLTTPMAPTKAPYMPSVQPQPIAQVSRRLTRRELRVIKNKADLDHVLENVLDLRPNSDIYAWISYEDITSVDMLVDAGIRGYDKVKYPRIDRFVSLGAASSGNLQLFHSYV